MFKKSELTECELNIMKCVWDAGDPVTCPEIMARLLEEYELDYKDTTVYTFLKNLKLKGFVTSERKGMTYYKATRDEKEYRNDMLERTRKFWFNGSTAKLIAALIEMEDMTEEEKAEIRKVVETMK